jgi:hypothetical protein
LAQERARDKSVVDAVADRAWSRLVDTGKITRSSKAALGERGYVSPGASRTLK